jgi:hypothetical protein
LPKSLRPAALLAAAIVLWGARPASEDARRAPSEAPIAGVRAAAIVPRVVDVSRLPPAGAAAANGENDEAEELEAAAWRNLPHNLPVPSGARIRIARGRNVESRAARELPPSPPAAAQFDALGDDGFVKPPDVDGAVGPADVVTMLNVGVRIQDRSGAEKKTIAPRDFWGVDATTQLLSDPNLLYDAPAGRWVAVILAGPSAPDRVLIAVSRTADPGGAWSIYDGPTGSGFPDFPRVGLSATRIVIEVNRFVIPQFVGSEVLVFDKAALYRGEESAPTAIASPTLGPTLVPSVTQEPGRDEVYLLQEYNGLAGEGGLLRLYALTGDLGSESLRPIAFPGSPERWSPAFEFGSDRAPQKNSDQGLDTVDARLSNVVLRRGFLWTAHTVFLPAAAPTRSVVQWWQIGLDGSVADHGRVEDPTGDAFLAFPSIAVNRDDHVLIGFAVFSADTFAGGGYAYRSAADSAGLTRTLAVLKEGEDAYVWGSIGDSRNRWGDYSTTVTDPVDDSSFWTIQEYAAPRTVTPPQTSKKSHWGTWWGAVSPETPSPPTARLELGRAGAIAGRDVEFLDASEGGPVEWTWSFGDGTGSTQKNPLKRYAEPGSYEVTLTASNRAGTSTATRSVLVSPAPPRGAPRPVPAPARTPAALPPRH